MQINAAGHTKTGTNSNFENQKLAEESHKLIIRKFKKCKLDSSFKDDI